MGGRHQSATAGFQSAGVEVAGSIGAMGLLRELIAFGIPIVHLGEAIVICGLHIEAGVHHIERFEQARAKELSVGHAADSLDDIALQVHSNRIEPLLAGL